jgi:hypothetical protein
MTSIVIYLLYLRDITFRDHNNRIALLGVIQIERYERAIIVHYVLQTLSRS